MKKLLSLGVISAVAAALAVPAVGSTTTITVGDNFFKPATKTVSKGTTVKWVFKGKIVHNVTVSKGPQNFASTTKQSGTFTHKMTKKGTYTIVCTIHSGMKMTLKVK
jgi:plastocyanin